MHVVNRSRIKIYNIGESLSPTHVLRERVPKVRSPSSHFPRMVVVVV